MTVADREINSKCVVEIHSIRETPFNTGGVDLFYLEVEGGVVHTWGEGGFFFIPQLLTFAYSQILAILYIYMLEF